MFGINDEDLFQFAFDGPLSDAVERNPPPGWNLIRELREMRNEVAPDRMLRRVVDAVDYESGLSSRARANIEKFLAGLRSRYDKSPAPLSTILNEIESAAPDSEAPPADFGDAVRLMTIHKSKGLEFPIVFLPFLHSSRGAGFPVVSYSHQCGLGIKWRDPATRKGVPDAIHTANQDLWASRQAAEDNRVLYVGMTRAKDRLILSFSDTKYSRGKWAELIQSRLAVDTFIDSGWADRRGTPPLRERTTDTQMLPRLRPTDQHDATASVTDVSVFAQCPRKYYLARYLGFKSAPTASTGAIQVGNQTHAILAGKAGEDVDPEALALAEVFKSSALGRRYARAARKAHEYDFVFALDDVVLRGQIDLWFEHNGDLVIVDYKTDRHVDPAPYEVQLQLYAHALNGVTRAYLYFLRANEPVEVNLSPLALAGARETVRDFTRAQESLEFPLKTGTHCVRCEFYGSLCPAPAMSS
jgi:ATP-dependent helicase/nuclease subunit A